MTVYVIQYKNQPEYYWQGRCADDLKNAKTYKTLSGAKSAKRSLDCEFYTMNIVTVEYCPACGQLTLCDSPFCSSCNQFPLSNYAAADSAAEAAEIMVELELDAPIAYIGEMNHQDKSEIIKEVRFQDHKIIGYIHINKEKNSWYFSLSCLICDGIPTVLKGNLNENWQEIILSFVAKNNKILRTKYMEAISDNAEPEKAFNEAKALPKIIKKRDRTQEEIEKAVYGHFKLCEEGENEYGLGRSLGILWALGYSGEEEEEFFYKMTNLQRAWHTNPIEAAIIENKKEHGEEETTEPSPAPKLYKHTAEENAAALATLAPYLSPNSIITTEDGQSIRGTRNPIKKEKVTHEKNCPPSTRTYHHTPTSQAKALNGQTQGSDRGLRQSQRI